MRVASLLAAAAVAFFLAPAAAQDDGSNCISEQSDMDACSSPVFTVADAKLNETYGELRGLLSASEKIRLRDAERIWITYRDKECQFEAMGSEGGTDHAKEIAVCLADKTNIHLAELRRIVACKRDNECPWSGSN